MHHIRKLRWTWKRVTNDDKPERDREREAGGDSKSKLCTKLYDPALQHKTLSRVLLLIIVGNAILMGCLVTALWGFARIGDFNKEKNPWIKRLVNVVSLILTAALSLGIGALFDQLGYMIRWPLLARRGHTLKEVDDIFQLGSLTGSARLLLQDSSCFSFRKSVFQRRTTLSLFLLASTLGRLSVSLFGVGYSVNDVPVVQVIPETRASMWPEVTNNSNNLMDAVFAPVFAPYDFVDTGESSAFEGSSTQGKPFLEQTLPDFRVVIWLKTTQALCLRSCSRVWRSGVCHHREPMKMTALHGMSIRTMSTIVHNDTSVSYEYYMLDFNSSSVTPVPSNRSITSTAKCTRLERSPRSTQDDPMYIDNGSTGGVIRVRDLMSPRFNTVLNDNFVINAAFQETVNVMNYVKDDNKTTQIAKMRFDTCGPRCSTFWVLSFFASFGATDNYLAKCESSLSAVSEPGKWSQELAISDQRSLSILAALAFGDGYFPTLTMNVTSEKLTSNVTAASADWSQYKPDSTIRTFSDELLSNSSVWLRDITNFRSFPWDMNYTNSPDYPPAIINSSYTNPLFIFPPIFNMFNDAETFRFVSNSSAGETWLAGLLARMPVALIAYLDSSGTLNQTQIQAAQTISSIQSQLEVQWWRIWAVVATLLCLQFAAAFATLWYCRSVVVRDNSTLVLAQTLNTIAQECYYEVSSIGAGNEIARCMGDSELLYGTVWNGSMPRVDIRRKEQVEARFPVGEYD